MNKTVQADNSVNTAFQSLESFLSTSFDSEVSVAKNLSYHEMEEVTVRHEDALEQLQRNIHTLSVAGAKLRFMNREIRYLLKI